MKISYEDLPDPIFTIEVRGQADKTLSHPFGVEGSRGSVLSRQEAIERSSFFGSRRMLERGNVTEAFETVDQVHEGEERISA